MHAWQLFSLCQLHPLLEEGSPPKLLKIVECSIKPLEEGKFLVVSWKNLRNINVKVKSEDSTTVNFLPSFLIFLW